MKSSRTFQIRIWGEDACFSRPEMKVERVSYDVITPSAARGALEAILWKPAIQWRITRIEVLKEIRWQSVRRNELENKIPVNSVTAAMNAGKLSLETFIEDERQQRAGLILRDVDYIVHVNFSLTSRAGPGEDIKKFEEMFRRRLEKGQCHAMPYLGCREFSAYFSIPEGTETPIAETRDLGWMLHDMDFTGTEIQPRFFRAEMKKGIIAVPPLRAPETRA